MIAFNKINKQYGKQLLFVDASFQLNPGEKVEIGWNAANAVAVRADQVEAPADGPGGAQQAVRLGEVEGSGPCGVVHGCLLRDRERENGVESSARRRRTPPRMLPAVTRRRGTP